MRMPSPIVLLLAAIIAVLVAGAFATIATADDGINAGAPAPVVSE